MDIKFSKAIINLSMLVTLIYGFYSFIEYQKASSDITTVFGLLLLAVSIYISRYFYLINFVKRDRVTFHLTSKQKYPVLLDTIAGVLVFAVFPTLLIIINENLNSTFDVFDLFAMLLYFVGTSITLIAEAQRNKWKRSNPSQLFKGGLYTFANHINYFGESIAFASLCWLATGSVMVFILAYFYQFIDFALLQIPQQEKHLKQKYPKDYEAIKNRKKLIPLLY